MIKAIIMDIEGTTTSIAFVYDVLFPYAKQNLPAYIHEHENDDLVREQLALVSKESGEELDTEAVVQRLLEWMDKDRKVTPLKTLQGLIWEHGYRKGDFKGHVYSDVPGSLQRWQDNGISLYIYSSGSVHAQKLLFEHTEYGDLTRFMTGYFDTRIGNKQESESYERITKLIDIPPEEILFLSDSEAELKAADKAGLKTILLDRDNDKKPEKFLMVLSFDEINPQQASA